jgi:hypothetical protein
VRFAVALPRYRPEPQWVGPSLFVHAQLLPPVFVAGQTAGWTLERGYGLRRKDDTSLLRREQSLPVRGDSAVVDGDARGGPAMPMEHEHSPEAIQARLATEPRHTYLRDWVYGGIDGAVTTFVVISGVMGAALSPGIVLVLGVANLVADGFSMAASNYAGTRTERDELRYWEVVEHRHIEAFPDGEREEVRQICPAFSPTRMWMVTPLVRWTSAV